MPHGPILIVDDQAENLAVMRQILAENYSLVFARSGKEALNMAKKHVPALILLDIQMPDIDGITLCKQLKNDPHTEAIPVIFVTHLSQAVDETLGFAAGAVDYIVKPVSAPIVRARVNTHLSLVRASRLEKSYTDAITMLGIAGHYNDNDTGVHIWRMAEYSAVLAAALGWKKDACAQLKMAAPMHDTGKIGIPEAILRKPGKLDAAEWEIMRTHCQIGHNILSRSDAPLFQLAAEIALNHHEKWDGSGYPAGLSGTQIPESAQIVALADVFDALTMQRPYKHAWPVEEALQMIQGNSGSHFNPHVVAAFQNILPDILQIKNNWHAREINQE